jgi:hypothetical protein
MKLKNIHTNIRTKIIIKKTWLFTVGHYNEKSSPSSSFLFHNNNNNKKLTTTTTNILINMKINVNDYCFSLYNMILLDIVIYNTFQKYFQLENVSKYIF